MNKKSNISNLFATVLLAALVFGQSSIRAQAEETGVDTMVTTPQTFTVAAEKKSAMIPISFPKVGVYEYNINTQGFGDGQKIVYLIESPTAEKFISMRGFGGTECDITRVVESPQNLYLLIGADDAPVQEKTITITCQYFQADESGREIKPGESVQAVGVKALWYSFTLKKDSAVTISASKGLVALCDSKKQSLGYSASSTASSTVYLKKGKYYISTVKGRSVFKYTSKNLKLPANTTKKKAAAIKLGKKQALKFAAAEKGTKLFYKLKLTAPKKISVTYDTKKMNGNITVDIYKTKSNVVPCISGYSDTLKKQGKIKFDGQLTENEDDFFEEKKSVKLPAGTYYVEVGNTSGGDATIQIK